MRPIFRAPNVLIFAVFSLLLAGGAQAESEALLEAFRAYKSALASEDFSGALPHAERAIEMARQEYGEAHPKVATLLLNLGRLDEELSRLDEALEAVSRAVRIWERSGTRRSLGIIEALWTRADVYAKTGQVDRARKDYRRVVGSLEKHEGFDQLDVANALIASGRFEENFHEYKRARRLYRRAIKIREAKLPPEAAAVGFAHFFLARLELGARKYRSAEKQYKKALTVLENTYPPDAPPLLVVHEHLVRVYGKLGRDEELQRHLLAAAVVEESDADIQPLLLVSPKPPETFASDGELVVRFTVSERGEVVDPRIIESTASQGFERSVLKALAEWRYRPRIVDGKPVSRPGIEVKFIFQPQKFGTSGTGSHIPGY